MKERYNEILKLRDMLERADIPFDFDELIDGYRIVLNKDIIAVQFKGSYGHEKDLIEIKGALTKREQEKSAFMGWLNADEVFKRFEYCYEHNTATYGVKTNYEWFMEKAPKDKAQIIVNLAYKLAHEYKDTAWNDKRLINYIEDWFDKECE
jgi:hypothetical protein